MTYLLDTNVCIRYLNGCASAIRDRLHGLRPSEVVTCSAVKAELLYGASRSRDPGRSLDVQHRFLRPFRSLPCDDSTAEIAGALRAQLATRVRPSLPTICRSRPSRWPTTVRW